MTDTPKHIRELQRKIWLQRPPAERLLQSLRDNEALFLFWKAGKDQLQKRQTIGVMQSNDHDKSEIE